MANLVVLWWGDREFLVLEVIVPHLQPQGGGKRLGAVLLTRLGGAGMLLRLQRVLFEKEVVLGCDTAAMTVP